MHNLYFSWVRIILLFVLVGGSFYATRFFNPQPIDENLKEEDFVAYQEVRAKWNSEIGYSVNGENRNYGNLVALQPYFLNLDYYSQENFQASLEAVFIKAKSEKALDRKTLVVLPEHTGSGLILLNEKRPAFFSESWNEAVKYLKSSYLQRIAERSDESQKDTNQLSNQDSIQIKGDKPDQDVSLKDILIEKRVEIANAYHETFSYLAKKYSVSIIAGSILLPKPSIKNGKLLSDEGDIYHISVVYLASGKAIDPIVKKVHLSEWEKEFATAGDIRQDFIVKVPAWTVGNLIGEDSLHESIYKSIGSKKMDGIVAPSSSFAEPNWKDYGIEGDISNTNDLWIQNGISKFISNTKGKDNLQVFWKGELWNLTPKGETFTNRSSENLQRSGDAQGAKVMNLYF